MNPTLDSFTLLILLSSSCLAWSSAVPELPLSEPPNEPPSEPPTCRTIMRRSCRSRVTPAVEPSVVESEQQVLDIAVVHKVNGTFESATFGMGCFWSGEALWGGIKGVVRTTVGYSGGSTESPTYRRMGDHTEVIEIDFDPNVITYSELLDLFWHNNEYGVTTLQKRQYMSLIQYHNEYQQQIAEQSKEKQSKERASAKIVTEILPKTKFYPAEDYHQKYNLQDHRDLLESLNLDSDQLRTSYAATKLNGYLAGSGGLVQFQTEVDTMGLTPSQKAYCLYKVAHAPVFGTCGV